MECRPLLSLMDCTCLCHKICFIFVATSPSTLLLLSATTLLLWFLWKDSKTNLFCACFTIKIYLHCVSFRVLAKLISRATIYIVKHLCFTSHSGVISIGVRQSRAWVPLASLWNQSRGSDDCSGVAQLSLCDEWLGDQQCFFPCFTAHNSISQELLLQPAILLQPEV